MQSVPMQTRVIFVLAWQKQIIHHCNACIYKMMCSKIVCDCLFVVLILEWPLSSGGDMTCFYYITRTTIIYSLYEHDFGLPWLWDTDRGNTYISLTAARFDRRLVSSVAEREVASSNPRRTNTQGLKITEEKVLSL